MPSSRDLQLPEVLEFLPDEGVIRLHEQRVVILSAAALGLLRKELVTIRQLCGLNRHAARIGAVRPRAGGVHRRRPRQAGAVRSGDRRHALPRRGRRNRRLGAFVIIVPPLRERQEAIAPLAQEFVRRAAARFKRDVRGIAPDAMSRLLSYDWPGNVRELEHAIERAVILASGKRIVAQDLPPEVRSRSRQRAGQTFDLEQRERELIQQALERFGGSRRQAAEALRISPVRQAADGVAISCASAVVLKRGLMNLSRILCAHDDSDVSRSVLAFALALAKWEDAHVHVVHLADPTLRGGDPVRTIADHAVERRFLRMTTRGRYVRTDRAVV